MTSLADRAETLLALHVAGDPVVLPTVWDAWSARFAVDAGFAALTVGSHPLADAIGRADGEGMTFDEVVARVGEITSAVDVPVSVDVESGYGLEPSRIVDGLLAAGAVGLNIEDTVHGEGGRLRDADEHAAVIAGLRAAADAAGVHVVVNARTDVFMREEGEADARVDLAIDRLERCAAAGADSLYPVGFHDDATFTELATRLPLPINAIAHPATQDRSHLAALGVGRISFGPLLQRALGEHALELLGRWR